jgi:hypothetical protein
MTVPYEPITRHAWSPGDVVCTPCHHQLPNGACEEEWCGCVCRDAVMDEGPQEQEVESAALVDDKGEPMRWVEPPGKPEDLQSWDQIIAVHKDPMLKAGLDHWIAPIDGAGIDHSRLQKFVYRYKPFAATLIAMIQTAVLILVVTTNTDDTWAEAFVIVSCILTAAFVLASVIRPKE